MEKTSVFIFNELVTDFGNKSFEELTKSIENFARSNGYSNYFEFSHAQPDLSSFYINALLGVHGPRFDCLVDDSDDSENEKIYDTDSDILEVKAIIDIYNSGIPARKENLLPFITSKEIACEVVKALRVKNSGDLKKRFRSLYDILSEKKYLNDVREFYVNFSDTDSKGEEGLKAILNYVFPGEFVFNRKLASDNENSKSFYDAYNIPRNLAIECNGEPHYHPLGSDDKAFRARQRSDERKYYYSINNGIKIMYYTEKELLDKYGYPFGPVYTDYHSLVDAINAIPIVNK